MTHVKQASPAAKAPIGPLDLFWHLANLFGPAIGLGLITPTLAKLLWRHELQAVAWLPLAAWTTASSALMIVAGLVVFGRDGRMATYGAMVGGAALVVWWRGWRRAPRR